MLPPDWGAAILLLIALCVSAVKASTTEVIYSFAGDDDGEYTDTDVAIDAEGNLYGTSVLGGEFGSGTVWQLSPVGGAWVHTVLYSFTGGADGGEPLKELRSTPREPLRDSRDRWFGEL